MDKKYLDYCMTELENILEIPSPSGFTKEISNYMVNRLELFGYDPWTTNKGGVFVKVGDGAGNGVGNGLVLCSHIDTLGAMVMTIKDNGRLKVSPVGGLSPNNTEGENVTVFTREGKQYSGTFQMNNPSAHVNKDYNETQRTFENMEVVLDEKTSSRKETLDLGIESGDFVCFDNRFVGTEAGYIKSRFLDDKLSCAILLTLAKQIKDEGVTSNRDVYMYFTVFEEVGHGAGGTLPDGVAEILAVDMGCVGEGLNCDETMVSICAKDSQGPCNEEMVNLLIQLAKDQDINYCVDIYPFYASDADGAIRAGHDIRHCTVGPGVYASHGYERSHVDGIKNTFNLLYNYITS